VVQRGWRHARLQLLKHELLRTHIRAGLHQVSISEGFGRLLAGQPRAAAHFHGTSEQGCEGIRAGRQRARCA